MAHSVTAIIAASSVADHLLNDRTLVAVDLRDGHRLIPLEDDDLDSLGLDLSQSLEGFTYLSPSLIQFCAEHSHHGPLVYLETEYFGGMGTQSAAAFSNGALIAPTPLVGIGAINTALRSIGIIATSAPDEFDHIGLSRHRHTFRWKEAALNERQL
ncbi:hypothetical protein [Brevifollis gellanilyticus]|nr:hypothetical protein [Brevifollis gellanilyticus]